MLCYSPRRKLNVEDNKNGIPRAVPVVAMSWASGDIILDCHLPYRNLPSGRHTPMGNPKFYSGQSSTLTTDLKATEKTDKRKCFLFWAAAPKGPMTYAFTHMGRRAMNE